MPIRRLKEMRGEISNTVAKRLFERLYTAYNRAYGMDDIAVHIINDIALLEQRKTQYNDDIKERGVMIEWQNGKEQGGYREHPLLKEVPKIIEQQRKLLSELKLTTLSMKASPLSADNDSEVDEFEKF